MDFYGVYKGVRDAVWRFILTMGIHSLPVKIIRIANSMGIRVLSYSKGDTLIRLMNFPESDLKKEGFAVRYKGEWIIFYDDTKPDSIIRFTVAHELGHILLGHEMQVERTLFYRVRFADSKPQMESEADIFASRLLAPACVIAALGLTTPEEIMELCGISHFSATIRAERMAVLYKRNKFGTSPLERQVMAQFRPFVEEYKTKIKSE